MTADELAQRVRLHNALQMVLGITLIPISLVLWVLSWFFFRMAIGWPLDVLGVDIAWTIGSVVASLAMIPLAIDGVRGGRKLFVESGYWNNAFAQSETGNALSWRYGSIPMAAFLIEQCLLCAPRALIFALRALRSRLPLDSQANARAAELYKQLKASRKWTPANQFPGYNKELLILRSLNLIWTETEGGELMVRYPAGAK